MVSDEKSERVFVFPLETDAARNRLHPLQGGWSFLYTRGMTARELFSLNNRGISIYFCWEASQVQLLAGVLFDAAGPLHAPFVELPLSPWKAHDVWKLADREVRDWWTKLSHHERLTLTDVPQWLRDLP